jgi:hypothetical protein
VKGGEERARGPPITYAVRETEVPPAGRGSEVPPKIRSPIDAAQNPGQCNQPTPAPTEMRERRTERYHQYPCEVVFVAEQDPETSKNGGNVM